jgi:hypothetical protein
MVDFRDKILTGMLVVLILIAAIVVIYYNLPENEEKKEILLRVSSEGGTWEYGLNDLENLDEYRGYGGMKTKAGMKGPNEYTGLRVSILLEKVGISTNVTDVQLRVIAADGYNTTFEATALEGFSEVYDASGNSTDGTATLIIAYKENGVYVDEENGPLRMAYIGEDPLFTNSSFWVKQVTTIEAYT